MRCLRCKTTELVALGSPENISFYECPSCQRNFTKKPGGALHFRWRHPISLILYPVIFKKNPMEYFKQIAAQASTQDPPATPDSIERTRRTIQEIRLELDDPTQQVRDILDCCASEDDLRNYLRCMAEFLENQLKKGGISV